MHLRNLLKRHLPQRHHLEARGVLAFISERLHIPDIWYLHRRSSAAGATIGIFCAFIPLPVQTTSAIVLSILFRANLPLAILFSLTTNPLTITPIFFFAYRLGVRLLRLQPEKIDFSLSLEWISHTLVDIWQPLLLGCFIMASISASITYIIVRLLWRISVINHWENHRKS